MTDKEWKELCDWAYKYSDKAYLSGVLDICDGIEVNIDKQMILKINKYGDLKIYSYNKNMEVFINIVDNRTPKQIKAIITNLL